MKRAVPLLLATLLVATVAFGSAAVSGGGQAGRASESPYMQGAGVSLLGDVSCDGAVSIVDAQLIAQSVAGIIAGLGCAANADTDGDGGVTTVDALLIAQLVAGLIERLPADNCVTLTLNVGTGQGSIIYTPTNSGGCPANQYSSGTQVTLTATAAPGSVWSSWSGTD
ncbi:MAG: dockerin type I repeat-containing protein, partial [Chloroflexi bacterium]|nr:dockerin type I repeat-containing protein [Chloroflexota bacterium]